MGPRQHERPPTAVTSASAGATARERHTGTAFRGTHGAPVQPDGLHTRADTTAAAATAHREGRAGRSVVCGGGRGGLASQRWRQRRASTSAWGHVRLERLHGADAGAAAYSWARHRGRQSEQRGVHGQVPTAFTGQAAGARWKTGSRPGACTSGA